MSNSAEYGVQERQALLSKLLDAVKQCQIRFGGRTELATESDSRVVCLCAQFEAVLQHGFRKNNKGFLPLRHVTEMMKGLNLLNGEGDAVFWQFVRTILNKHEYERYMLLKNISTDTGRGRAWLRSALNEHSLERYIHMMLADGNQVSQFYEDWAFLMDQERSSMLPMMAAGLGSILFAISIDNADLNFSRVSRSESPVDIGRSSYKTDFLEPEPVLSKSVGSAAGKKKRKKKRPSSQVVSFDDDDIYEERIKLPDHPAECNSAPATCLSSPVQLTGNFYAFTSVRGTANAEKTRECMGYKCAILTGDKTSEESSNTSVEQNTRNVGGTSVYTARVPDDSSKIETPAPSEDSEGSPEISASASKYTEADKVEDNTVLAVGSSHTVQTLQVNSCDTKRLLHLTSVTSITSSASDVPEQCIPSHTTLTPIGDPSVGELIPVSQIEDINSSEDSISIPSFGEDTDNAVAALAIAQRVPSWSVSSSGSQRSRKGSDIRSRSETLTMTTEELREAVLAVLQKKEEVEEKNNALRSLLDREMEMSAGLRAELEEMQKHHEEKIERLEMKIQTVTRENELLKHQLKKYIAAVQMLKHDSSKVHELTSVVGEIQPAIPEPKVYIDHQFEANEYEKKLVQVAEMHGELMEFNERLHRLLLQREAVIRRLREELIDLRGPLPDDNQTSDDDISITSDYDASSQTATVRPLINVWIPSAFLTGRTADVHHVYQVYVRIRDDEWNVYRRYAQFYALHRMLKKKDAIVNTFDFPPKKTIGKKDAKVVEQRRRRLQHYLRCVLNWLLQNNADLANSPDKETFISLLPFFGDQPSEHKKPPTNISSNRLRMPGANTSPVSQETGRGVQHYTGL